MAEFKVLNEKKAKKVTFKIMLFLKKFPLLPDYPNKENEILSHIYKYLNLIFYHDLKDKKFNVSISIIYDNKNKKIDIFDNSSFLLQQFYNELKKNITFKGLSDLLELNTYFLKTENINLYHKADIIDAENTTLKEFIENFIDTGNEKIVYDFIHQRLEIVFESIYSFDKLIKDDNHFNQEPDALYNIFSLYLRYKVNFHIYRNQIFQVFNYLKEELELNEDGKIKKVIIKQLVDLNSRFQIEHKTIYLELLDEEAELFNADELEFLKMIIEANPQAITVSSVKFSQGSISKKIVEDNQVFTIIRFSLPVGTKIDKNRTIQINEKYNISYKELENKFSDPVLRLYKDFSMGGMGWNFFSDTFHSKKDKLCTFAFVIPNFYHPDFEFGENGLIDTDFSNKKAITGRDYYPHKELIIQNFLDHFEIISKGIDIEKKDITIDLFSNYVVDYINSESKSLIYRRLYAVTNPDSYSKASDKFIERLTELNLADSFLPLSDLVKQTNLVSDTSLCNFMNSLINIVLKNNIELHSNYKYFWKKDGNSIKPQREPDMQPLIMGQLKTICDYIGIQLSREVESANGEIDFLCSFTYNSKVLKTCIELKNAHSPKYELGLTKQLPEYLKSERTKHGIYLVLWYKGDDFSEPISYVNIEKLREYLDEKRPKGFKTKIIIIDCSKPIVPSKLK